MFFLDSDIENDDLLSFILKRNQELSVPSVIRNSNSTSKGIILSRQYFEEPSVSLEIDPIHYWLDKSSSDSEDKKYFKKLVKKYFCIPATSVPSERLFSKAGNLLTVKRSKLKSKNVNMLLFINQNKWLLSYVL